jgi:ATP-binding cassette subfamily D (ALD) long-chain fatty acid import protein
MACLTWSGNACGSNKGADLNSGQVYIMRAIGAVFGSLGQLLSWPERIAVLAGNVKRVAELDEVLSDLEKSISTTANSGASVEDCGDDLRIVLDGVDVVTPAGECCVSNLSLEISHGQSLMVTGANATGKSSLGRVLTGE